MALSQYCASERACAARPDQAFKAADKPVAARLAVGASTASAAKATTHSATQAAIRWPSAQVSISWSATTTIAATKAASNMVARLLVVSNCLPKCRPKSSKALAMDSARTMPGCLVGNWVWTKLVMVVSLSKMPRANGSGTRLNIRVNTHVIQLYIDYYYYSPW